MSVKNWQFFSFLEVLKNVENSRKKLFSFLFLEKCVAVWVKCDWTFFKFWGVNSTSKEKIWLSWIDIPKTRNENETNFGGSKISNNTCGLWSVQHVRDVMIFTYRPFILNLWVKISRGSPIDVTFNAELVLKNSGKNVEFCQKMWLIDIYSMSRKYNSLPKSHSRSMDDMMSLWVYI